MKRPAVAIVLALLLLLPILFMGALIAIAGEDVAPSDRALNEIRAGLLLIYMSAASTCEGLDWTVLAAIHKVETDFGRGAATSPKGARGPMQFMPSTWDAYGTDGNGDGLADTDNVRDAIFSAAFMLCENGGGDPARLADAIWNYNHSDQYVAEILDLATSYGVAAFGTGLAKAAPGDLLDNPRITLTSSARADLEAGLVDSRVNALLDAISRRYPIGVTVLKAGHSTRTRSGSISNHYYGRAVDIFFVDGSPVSSSSLPARQVVGFLARLEGQLRPSEVGHPFSNLYFPGGFTDADHLDHIHLGFD
ncbi:MAG: lytic murein transglycosylase [Actinobacteria bacterium]|nr:lytic murein transglycosylase [Actinomycetota bacterium]